MIANYLEHKVPSYRGNPLIEALPPLKSSKEVAKELKQEIEYCDSFRELDGPTREHLLLSVLQFFEPLPHHMELESKISRALRFGYTGRNPLERGFWTKIPGQADHVLQRVKEGNASFTRSVNTGFGLVGVSGTGKTTAVERILHTYPQVIYHSKYQGQDMCLTQLAWLKLDCPFDGSVKGLCLKFFCEVDDILGTDYYEKAKRGRQTIDQLIPLMARIGAIHCIGMLVIDEIQHLATFSKRSQNQRKMINFFVELINTIKMPIMLIGTPKALSVLTQEFRSARRSAGQGDVVWNRLEKGAVWDYFLEAFWGYQYTKVTCPLTKELSRTLYEETQGITDFAVKLYLLTQCRAIRSGEEQITPDMIKSVAKDSLNMAQPFLKALKTGDFSALPSCEDIRPVHFEDLMDSV
jgi:hypothetical protein